MRYHSGIGAVPPRMGFQGIWAAAAELRIGFGRPAALGVAEELGDLACPLRFFWVTSKNFGCPLPSRPRFPRVTPSPSRAFGAIG